MTNEKTNKPPVEWAELLKEAVNKPGTISKAYSHFWRYSPGNQLLALWECHKRGIEAGPIATFKGWQGLNRWVRKGQKAITLCMPVVFKKKVEKEEGTEEEVSFRKFIYRPNWFVLSQTDGEAFEPEPIPGWDEATALATLGIEKKPFDMLDGNVQGYARDKTVTVSPIAFAPEKTLFHEVAHVVLGHTLEGLMSDSEKTPRSLQEAEAESVALIVLESLGLPGAEHCRGYIQHWYRAGEIPEKSAQKIFKAADAILKAGRPQSA